MTEIPGAGRSVPGAGRSEGFDVRHDSYACPGCGMKLDASHPVSGPAIPEPGDLTICLYCGSWNAFTQGGMRKATEAEVISVLATPEGRAAQDVALRWRDE